MNKIVYKGENGQALTTSILVAEVFNKEHRNVMRDIRNLIEGGVLKNEQTPMFVETTYINEQNKQEYPMFVMNRDGFTLLAMGFTGEKALFFKLEYIQAFNAMEQQIKQVTASYQIEDPIKRAEKWIEEEKERQRLQLENQKKEQLLIEQQPKVVFADAVTGSADTYTMKELATILAQRGVDIGLNRLYRYMRDNNYFGTRGYNFHNLPYQKYVEQGLFGIEINKDAYINKNGEYMDTKTVMVTGKGLQYFINKFLNNKN